MKINNKCVQSMYAIFAVLILLFSVSACNNVDPVFKKSITEEYPSLYEAVFSRDYEAIIKFTDSPDSLVQIQAWKALISTPVSNIDDLISRVVAADSKEAWASLWLKEISEEQINRLNELWVENPGLRTGLSSLLGEKGNEASLEILMETTPFSSKDEEIEIALAIGKLSGRVELDAAQEIEIITRALSTKEGSLGQAYLYGLYRFRKALSPETEEEMIAQWANYYPDGLGANQYIARILFPNNVDLVLNHFPIEDYEFMDPRLAIEIAQGISRNEHTNYATIVLNALLDNRNPNVKLGALRAIQNKESVAEELDRAILNKAGLTVTVEPLVRLEGLNTIENPKRYEDKVYAFAGEEPYLQSLKYNIVKKYLTPEQFLELLSEDMKSENRPNRFYAIQGLASWWRGIEEDAKEENLVIQVRALLLESLGTADRSMIFVMGSLLSDPKLIPDTDYSLLEEMLSRFKLPEDVEVYQSISQVLKTRFEEQSKSLIDSLASEGNVALNRTLANQGWDIVSDDSSPSKFRTPDWKRLSKLGPSPVLVFETIKGSVRIRMDVLSAPATIAGMDSLIRAKAYYGIPFHRVVSNFVVQGGDVETQDGFGGPDYVVPTEVNAEQYKRGKVGIASAGTDTEGSQFFIMHQWAPHLTGRYSIVGEVIEGMNVVDRIVQGDVVQRMYWE